jgi:hypothetical protein
MLKLIYLAKRNPSFAPDDFTRRWRMHGALGMSTSLWRHAVGYVQAEPIRPTPIRGASDAYDAIACFMLKDDAFTGQFLPEDVTAAQALAKDELETFSAPIPTTSLWVREERLRAGELGGQTAYLFFADLARARDAAELYHHDRRFDRATLNTRSDDPNSGPMKSTLPYEAVLELSASSISRLVGALQAGAAPFRSADVAVLTREAVFWDRVPPID